LRFFHLWTALHNLSTLRSIKQPTGNLDDVGSHANACLDISHATITDQRSQDRQQCYKFSHITYMEVHAACPEVSHYVPTSTCMMLSNSPSPCRPENSEGGTDLRMSSALNGVNFQLGRKSSNS